MAGNSCILRLSGVAGILAAVASALALLWTPAEDTSGSMRPAALTSPVATAKLVNWLELDKAVSTGKVSARFFSHSRRLMDVRLRGIGTEPVEVVIPMGAVFERGEEQVVVIKSRTVTVAPGTETSQTVSTLSATGSYCGPGEFLLTGGRVSPLAVLLPHAAAHPEIPWEVLQTAALVLTENLPLSTFARFELVAGASPVAASEDDLRVDNRTIIRALRLLKQMGVPMDRVALNIDPQLLVESMTDPMARAEALEFYEIPPNKEWEFWKAYLEFGDQATRHYALYGIGQYFPEVAVDMMADWAKSEHLDESLRISAVQALARTGRIEALSVLSRLRGDLSSDPSMDLAIHQSTALLVQAIYDPFHLRLPADYKLTPPILRTVASEPAQ